MRFLAVIGGVAIAIAIAAAVYFFGGFYNVAATEEIAPVAWVLAHVRAASIDRHATQGAPLSLDDPALVRAGAHEFATLGCLSCHGGPGVKWAKFTEGMQPYPPDLKDIVNDREPRQLFWVVKNGIKMTAMPSFGAIGVGDPEIWSIVAFLKKLPTVTGDDFKTWIAGAGS
ncbi:MAG: cytochrome c [Alphaproteobacteria bacterium]|nr:cytochrome c [Alphaproteobacteria bacterium]